MINPLTVFTRWRLTSGLWLYWMILLGTASMIVAGAVLFDLALSLIVWLADPVGEPWPWVYPWLAGGLAGFGLFVLLFEVGLVDLMMAGRYGLRHQRMGGDLEIIEEQELWQKKRQDLAKRFR